jgi:hypothetical protein
LLEGLDLFVVVVVSVIWVHRLGGMPVCMLDKSELPDDGPGGKAEKRRLRKENRQGVRDQNFMKTQWMRCWTKQEPKPLGWSSLPCFLDCFHLPCLQLQVVYSTITFASQYHNVRLVFVSFRSKFWVMPARIQPSTFNDAFSFHAGPVMVQPVMARIFLRIEALCPTRWSYGIFLEPPVSLGS